MSTTAKDVSASLTERSTTLESKADTVAALLIEDDELLTEDEKGDESLTEASTTEDDDESNEELEANDDDEESEDTTLEAVVEEGDPTWEGMLGISEDSMSFDETGNIAGFKTKVNGEEQIVSTADLIAGFQNNKHVTQKGQAHAEEVKQFNVQKEQVEQAYASKLESVDALSKHFEKQLISEYENVDWAKLREDNPAEYAAMRQDYAVKAGELQTIQDAINTDRETAKKETFDANMANRKTYLKGQFDLMIEKNPEWSDEKVRNTARDGFKTFVQDQYGFVDSDWNLVNDARLIELIKDAKKYHDGASVAAKKTLKPVPKFQKSRGRAKPKTSKLEKLTTAAAKSTGGAKRDLQTSAVAELLLGGL